MGCDVVCRCVGWRGVGWGGLGWGVVWWGGLVVGWGGAAWRGVAWCGKQPPMWSARHLSMGHLLDHFHGRTRSHYLTLSTATGWATRGLHSSTVGHTARRDEHTYEHKPSRDTATPQMHAQHSTTVADQANPRTAQHTGTYAPLVLRMHHCPTRGPPHGPLAERSGLNALWS